LKGANNIEFADPVPQDNIYKRLTIYDIQSSDELYGSTTSGEMGIKESRASDFINLIHMGETVKSLRTILRRACFHRSVFFDNTIATSFAKNYYVLNFPRMPYFYGYDPDGLNLATNSIPATSRFNFVYNTPINIISSCFVAHRGSIIWHINTNLKHTEPATVKVERTKTVRTLINSQVYEAQGEFIIGDNARRDVINQTDGIGGISLSDTQTNHGSHTLIPYYNNFKFSSNNPYYRTLGSVVDNTIIDSVKYGLEINVSAANSTDTVYTDLYCSAGPDFNPVWFLNVPGLKYQPLPLAASA
jgi:hypothetical protein